MFFKKKKQSFRPTREEVNLFRALLLYVFSSLRKGRLDPDLVLFCAFSGKNGNTKNQKILFL